MNARYLLVPSLCLLPTLAFAHPGHGEAQSLFAGLTHPWLGVDHMIAMLAVGMWASQLGGKFRWVVPLTFISLMTLGAVLGFGGIHLGLVEQGIAVSVCLLGLFLSTAIRLPLVASVAMVACFALFHGYAHATEAISSSTLLYIGGFVVSTALLHALGVGIGILLSQHQRVIRWMGAAMAIGGVAMLFG